MEPNLPIKKLYKMALYTSAAIGVLVLEPLIMFITLVPSILKEVPFNNMFFLLLSGLCAGMIFVFIIWLINIQLTYLINKFQVNVYSIIKYIISYLICNLFFIGTLRLILLSKIPHNNEFILKTNHFSFELLRIIFISSINTIILIIQELVILREKKAVTELENAQLKLKNAELKLKNAETANQLLKQQIHPHFLFNSLNTLKTLIKENSKNAEIFLKRLSDFLRTSITFNNKNIIELHEELKFCMDYLELQKVRFGEALQYEITIPENVKTGFVPVFSLQQLLENAIKHNALKNNSPLLIKILCDNSRIIVTNNIQVKSITEESTGIGLANLSERYKILSGDEILIQADEHQFSVSFKILSHEDINN